MARVPEVIRRNPISQVAAEAPVAGAGWAALANLAKAGADFVKPQALKEAAEEGLKSVYRDANGVLKVKEKSALGGDLADAHNSAAFAKYLAQRKIDMSQSFTEMARNYEFDPAGFKTAASGYIKIMQEDEAVPPALKDELLLDAQAESDRRFNGLYDAQTDRNYRDADRNTLALRDMMADDYINLVIGGDMEAAASKLKEIEDLSSFRANAPYIAETEAERDAYLRGLRGATKAVQLTKTLVDLGGAASISDELKSEIEATLKDPDLSPDARQKLYAATQGRLKGIDAAGIVSGLTDGSYASKVTRAESGGVADAKNPNSSATGIHQFISGTWMQNVRELQKQGGAQWANGLSNDDILEMRKNPAASNEVFAHFTAKNQQALAQAGIPVNDATTYMAHFFGVGGAITVLKADPSAMISDLLPGVVKANPFMADMTVADATNWAARKMTVKSSDIDAMMVQVDQIPDQEVRAMAAELLGDRSAVRKRMEAASAAEYETRLQARDDTLTEAEVRRDHNLSDAAQSAISAELKRINKDKIEVQQTIAAIATPGINMNFGDSKTRSSVDKAYTSLIGDDAPMSDVGMRAAGEIVVARGYLPKPSFDALRSSVYGNDPAALAQSMEFLHQVTSRSGTAITYHDGRSDLTDALSDYTFYSGFMGAEAAAARMIEDRLPENVAKRRNLSDAAKTAAKTLKPRDLVDHLSGIGVAAELGTEGQQAEMMTEYDRLFSDAYVKTGDSAMAKQRALDELSRFYGPDGVTGSERLMKFPPQNFYAAPADAEPGWMTKQIVADVNRFAKPEAMERWDGNIFTWKGQGLDPALTPIGPSDISITSDERTRGDIASRKSPTYRVGYFDDDGMYQEIPERYSFAPPAAKMTAQEFGTAQDKAKSDAKEMSDRIDADAKNFWSIPEGN